MAKENPLRLTDRKRQAILEAAVSEFQQDGFAGASMNRIAARAGVSKRTVYNHFPSKEDLFNAIIANLVDRSGAGKSIQYDPSMPLDKQLQVIGRDLAHAILNEDFIKLARVVVSRFIQSPEIAIVMSGAREEMRQGLVRWIRAAKRDGRLTIGNPIRAARQFTGLITEFAFWPQLVGTEDAPSKREVNRVVNSATQMFLSQYGVEGNSV